MDGAGGRVGAPRGREAVDEVVDRPVVLRQEVADPVLGLGGEGVGVHEPDVVPAVGGEFGGGRGAVPAGGRGAAPVVGRFEGDADAADAVPAQSREEGGESVARGVPEDERDRAAAGGARRDGVPRAAHAPRGALRVGIDEEESALLGLDLAKAREGSVPSGAGDEEPGPRPCAGSRSPRPG
ncbi:hypothetical protein Slala03_55890 [Streptomyces lavendulae subsp. lavendulae]|nr:hypothetical protein Slala03_55890 [Streptomyces lavendulae subsp. lavendulae]